MKDEVKIPEGYFYTKEHEWIKLEGDLALVGISDYAQGQLHEIVYVELPKSGIDVNQGEAIGAVE